MITEDNNDNIFSFNEHIHKIACCLTTSRLLHKMIKLLLVYIFFVCYSTATAQQVITIDVHNGTDSLHCLNGSLPCKSLEFVTKNGPKDNIILEIKSSLIDITNRIKFCQFRNITIRGDGADNTTLTCAANENKGSIEFHNSTGITLSQLSITSCGMNFDMPNKQAKFSTALYFNKCHHVNIKQVCFKNNNGLGVQFTNTTNLSVSESVFRSNYYRAIKDSGHLIVGGGMFVYYNETRQEPYFINISSVTFDSNSANTMEIATFNFVKTGGGLKLDLGSNQTNATVSISDCTFKNNTAVSGGGVHLFIFSSSSYNNITFDNCTFTNNDASVYSGGGLDMYISTWGKSRPVGNKIKITKCHFTNNRAKNGGGVSIYSPRSPCIKRGHRNSIDFTESVFIRNVANTSAAVDINNRTMKSYGDTFLTNVTFTNCQFKSNRALQYRTHENYKYTAFRIMFTVDISLTFSGTKTLFENNTGTALYIVSTTVTFTSGSVTKFTNNTGDRGGAMLLTENGAMKVGSKAELRFTNNNASLGGAICIIPNIFYHGRTCFIQRDCYQKKKSCEDSTAQYIFRNNTAGIGFGNDIFASTFSNCKGYTNGSLKNIFIGKKMGLFNFSLPLNESVATAVSSLVVYDKELSVYPGIPQEINITQYDDFKNNITEYFSLYAHLEGINGSVKIDQGYRTLSTNKTVLEGTENSSANLILETSGLSNSAIMIKVNLLQCPPGYSYYKGKCNCLSRHQSDTQSNSSDVIISCSLLSYKALINCCKWAGYLYYNGTMQFVTPHCSISLCSYPKSDSKDGKHYLPLNRSELNDYVCSPHRHGTLCGNCSTNYTTYFHSPTFKCGDTNKCSSGIAFYLLSEILPVTLIFLFIMLFDVNLTSGALYSFIFYAQILNNQFNNIYPVIVRENKGILLYTFEILKMVYGVFDFDVFENDSISFCIMPKATVLDMLILKYLSTFYAFFLIIATIVVLKLNSFYACIKFCHKCGRRNIRGSVINGLTAFLVLTYYRCLIITLKILFPSYISIAHYRKLVSFYNGNLGFMKDAHLKYAIPALICFVCIILPPPLLLISEPLLIQFSGRINLRRNRLTYSLHILRMKMKPFLDSFQGCFRDNCRSFAGLFFLYRILIVPGEYLNGLVWNNSYEGVILFLVLLLHSMCHPFQNWHHNQLDIFLLVDLLMINFLMGIEYLIYIHEPFEANFRDDNIMAKFIGALILVLILIPLGYLLVYSYRKVFPKKKYSVSNNEQSESLPARLLNSQVDNYGSINR